jgi:prepilin-type N-terminal cleavage/methylation domain-containing protein
MTNPSPNSRQAPACEHVKPPRCVRRAVSMIELVVVILIIGILSAASLPRFSSSLTQYRLTAAANRIVTDLARAQSAAYGSSASKTVTFNVGAGSYEITGVKSLEHSSGSYVVDLTADPYQSGLMSVWGQTGAQSITFNGYGLPDKGGTIVVVCGGASKAISVSATTGTAVLQ